MNLPKGETRQELLNRAFLYVLIIAFSVLIFLRVKSLIFDLFVAIVLAALAEPVVYRLSKKISRQSAACCSFIDTFSYWCHFIFHNTNNGSRNIFLVFANANLF